MKNKLIPFKDGIILEKGFNRAVFLPQVWEQLPDFFLFLKHLCRKARLSGDCIWSHPVIHRFGVKIIEDDEKA